MRAASDVSALAARGSRSATVLVWNYHDDDLPGPAAEVALTVGGLPDGRATLTHYRIDGDHSNSYARWKAMGSPQSPTAAQYTELEASGRLQTLGQPSQVTIAKGAVVTNFALPRQDVSLVKIDW